MIRRFQVERDDDITGVSGTGFVAEGVEFSDGTVVIRWRGDRPSTVTWAALADAYAIHGHDGNTRFVFLDRATALCGKQHGGTDGTVWACHLSAGHADGCDPHTARPVPSEMEVV